MMRHHFLTLPTFLVASACFATEPEVRDIRVTSRQGQTFVSWKDVAAGEEGARYRYRLYRSDQPITADNIKQAELCFHGVLNNSVTIRGL